MAPFQVAGSRRGLRSPIVRRLGPLVGLVVLYVLFYQSGIYRSLQGRNSSTPSSGGQAASEGDSNAKNGGKAAAAPAPPPPLPPRLSDEEIAERCAGTLGGWCSQYFRQQPIPRRPPPHGNKTCLWGCNSVGKCNHLTGWCQCPAGWTGNSCSKRERRPCSQWPREYGFEPDERSDRSLPNGLHARCGQYCDEDIGTCMCNATWAHGHIPAPLDAPPGTPPIRRGRPLSYQCQPNKDEAGNPSQYGQIDPDLLWGPEGWCQADMPNYYCPCLLDGYGGGLCEEPQEMLCMNQCNGHGECYLGYCKCHQGWWGHDCAYRAEGTPWTPGLEEVRPWIRDYVHTPASKDPEPGAIRLRPLIYVYELPPKFNSHMLQYRPEKTDCSHRLFDGGANTTIFIDWWLYATETAFHEALLQSEHRTLDPEEADFFFIPIYATCYLYPINGFNDFPFFHSFHNIPRVHSAINMLIEAHNWISTHHPYWDRNGGRDHIILQTHDEGSCWLPAVLRPAIMLAHWGRMDEDHISNTGYPPDNYTQDADHPLYMPEGTAGKLGRFPCYDPDKDLIIPPMSSMNKYPNSPLLGAPTKARSILGFFKGRVQQNNPPYSRGIRQKLENLTRDEDWWGKYKVTLGENMPEGLTLSYSEALASSIFCFALPGDGWSARFEDAILHGCIPVIIQDNVHLAWESIVDYSTFTIRILEKDLERVPQILQAVPPEKVESMQRAMTRVWRRWSYTGYKAYGAVAQQLMDANVQRRKEASPAAGSSAEEVHLSLPHPISGYNITEGDAMETIYAWLYSRIPDTRGPVKPKKPKAKQPQQQAQQAQQARLVRKKRNKSSKAKTAAKAAGAQAGATAAAT